MAGTAYRLTVSTAPVMVSVMVAVWVGVMLSPFMI